MIKIFSMAVSVALGILFIVLAFLFVRSLQQHAAVSPGMPIFETSMAGDLDGGGEANDFAVLAYDKQPTGAIRYYAVLELHEGKEAFKTNAVYLGDRIAPQTIEILDGRAVYNFAERAPGESMSVQPSIGKSVWINYDKATRQIGEWVKDFEGEAAAGLTEPEASAIAQASCIKGGEALAAGIHNKNTQTWWFDANLNATRPGCNPACVVNEVTKTAEINWRCTGAIAP